MKTCYRSITHIKPMLPAHFLLAILMMTVMVACVTPSQPWGYAHGQPPTIAPMPIYPSLTPSATPTPRPTLTPTSTPFPTASAIHSQAVAFIMQNGASNFVRDGLRITNLDGSGEQYLLSNVFNFRWSPDGTQLAAVARKGVWILMPTLDTMQQVFDIYSDEQAAVTIAWSPDSRWLAVWNQQQLQIISRDGAVTHDIVEHSDDKGAIVSADWSPDSTRLAILQRVDPLADRPAPTYVRIANIITGTLSDVTYYPKANLAWLRWSPDGRFLAYAHADRFVEIVDTVTAKVASRPDDIACGGMISALTWSNVEQWVLLQQYGNGRYGHSTNCLAGWGKTFNLTDSMKQTTAIMDKAGQAIYLLSANFAPDDRTVKPDSQLFRYDIQSQQMEAISPWPADIWPISLSPDGHFLAGFAGEKFEVIDLTTLTIREYPLLSQAYYRELAWSSDSHHIIYPYRPITDFGLGPYSALFALDIVNGNQTRLTNDYLLEQWAISPASNPP